MRAPFVTPLFNNLQRLSLMWVTLSYYYDLIECIVFFVMGIVLMFSGGKSSIRFYLSIISIH